MKLNMMDNVEDKKYSGRYTNYAIYVDKHLPDIAISGQNPLIEAKVYKYLYEICYVLSCKEHYFDDNFSDYEDFAYYAATEFYTVFKDKYNNRGKVRRGKVVEPIKSCLNFIKGTLYQLNVDYKAKFFSDTSSANWSEKNAKSAKKQREDQKQLAIGSYMTSSVNSDYNYLIEQAVSESCSLLPKIIKNIVYNKTPFKTDPVMTNRLYKSCLLSMLNSVTLPKSKLCKKESMLKYSKGYAKERTNCIICWNLSSDLEDYISILLERSRQKLADEIENDKHYLSLNDIEIKNILDTSYPTYDSDRYDKYGD